MAEPECPQSFPYSIEVEPGTYHWCSCGKSEKQPFCDGSHAGSEFKPVAVVIKEKQNVSFCGCKRSANPPYCDGAHNKM